MDDSDRLWMDAFGFVYSGDGKRLLKGANVKGAYWIPEGVEEVEPGALIGCQIGTLHVPWTAHVHDMTSWCLVKMKKKTRYRCLQSIFGRNHIRVVMKRRGLLRMKGSIGLMNTV